MKKYRMLIFGLFCILSLAVVCPGILQASETAEATAATEEGKTESVTKLNASKMYFYVGGKSTLKLLNAGGKSVKWKSSKKSVATVSSKGKVKAKKTGKCTITATCGKKKYKCRIIVLSDKKFLAQWCKDMAKSIKKAYSSPYDRVLAATYYVSSHFSYGKSAGAFETLTKGKGTCVGGNKLLVKILKAMGFKAKLRFAAKDKMSRYPKGIVFASEHHNVQVKIKGKTYYVDGTPETGFFYMSSSKKPIYMEIYIPGYESVTIDKVPGHK